MAFFGVDWSVFGRQREKMMMVMVMMIDKWADYLPDGAGFPSALSVSSDIRTSLTV